MSHGSNPERWVERRAISMCDQADRKGGRESGEMKGVIFR